MSFLDKLKQRVDSVIEYKSKLFFTLSEEEKNKRISICNSCEFLFTPTRNCKKCGCFVDGKAVLAISDCPINKWPKIIVKEQ
jgi:hypothetical protein